MSQLSIQFEEKIETNIPLLRELTFGEIFTPMKQGKNTYMKVKSVNFLNNSNILSDVFARGDCLVVCLERGTISVMKGDLLVTRLEGTLTIKKIG